MEADYKGIGYSTNLLRLFFTNKLNLNFTNEHIHEVEKLYISKFLDPNNHPHTRTNMYMGVGIMLCCSTPNLVTNIVTGLLGFRFDDRNSIDFLIQQQKFSPLERERMNIVADYHLPIIKVAHKKPEQIIDISVFRIHLNKFLRKFFNIETNEPMDEIIIKSMDDYKTSTYHSKILFGVVYYLIQDTEIMDRISASVDFSDSNEALKLIKRHLMSSSQAENITRAIRILLDRKIDITSLDNIDYIFNEKIKPEIDINLYDWLSRIDPELHNLRLVTIANNGDKKLGIYDAISNEFFIL